MAFMVPIVQNEWDLYGMNKSRDGRRSSQQASGSSGRSRSHSQASSGFSRPPSFSSGVGSPAAAPCNRRSLSGGSSLSSGQRSVTFGPPSPPAWSGCGNSNSTSSSKAGFHAKVVDKLMKVMHRDSGKKS